MPPYRQIKGIDIMSKDVYKCPICGAEDLKMCDQPKGCYNYALVGMMQDKTVNIDEFRQVSLYGCYSCGFLMLRDPSHDSD